MTLTRIPILGSTGILLLQLVACSANESARTANAGAQNERVDGNVKDSGTDSDTEPDGGDCIPRAVNEADSPCAEPFDLEKLKWLNKLEKPRVFKPSEGKDEKGKRREEYTVRVRECPVQMLPKGCATTQVFAYGGATEEENGTNPRNTWTSPGATFEMKRGTPARVEWVNEITGAHLFPIDPTLHWANPKKLKGPFGADYQVDPEVQSPVPIVTHVHGLEVGSDSDGATEAWFTASGINGPDRKQENKYYYYPNSQPATTLWYHDHALGITRLNVYAGLAGMYVIRDPADKFEHPESGAPGLPDREHEMPLVIQDKSFNYSDGSLVYTSQRSDTHPYWSSFFGGETFVVNGKVWPVMEVQQTRYRFRMLNGGNNGTLNLSLPESPNSQKNRKITVIGSDGGYLAAPTDTEVVRLGPGERADVVIDFTDLAPGQSLTLSNGGTDVVRFTVLAAATVAARELPQQLNTTMALPTPNVDKRTVTLHPAPDSGYLLNGQKYHSEVSELPVIGSTEDWDIVNISGDAHPIHLHLVQFQVIRRRQLDDVSAYQAAWNSVNDGGALPLVKKTNNPDASSYLRDESKMDEFSKETAKILATESGWKDTVIAPDGFVTTIRVRWAPQDAPASTTSGSNPFADFNPADGPGYVWHCHMLEHEDNDMMRPLKLMDK